MGIQGIQHGVGEFGKVVSQLLLNPGIQIGKA